jgi:hypothetical protein
VTSEADIDAQRGELNDAALELALAKIALEETGGEK